MYNGKILGKYKNFTLEDKKLNPKGCFDLLGKVLESCTIIKSIEEAEINLNFLENSIALIQSWCDCAEYDEDKIRGNLIKMNKKYLGI